MANNQLATVPTMDAALMEKAVVEGDLSKMSSAERLHFYSAVCTSLGLNPATRPFGYIRFNDGGLQLYAKKDAAEQLRKLYGVSITKIEKRLENDIYTVTAYAQTRDGRMDVDEGAVSVRGLGGLALANAYKKAVTQAKRRVTLSICGLGFLDETETEDVPRSQVVEVNHETGEIMDGEFTEAEPDPVRVATLTQPDVRKIKDHSTEKHVAWDAVTAHAERTYGVDNLHDLTKEQGRELHRWITQQARQASQGQPLDPQLNPTDEELEGGA